MVAVPGEEALKRVRSESTRFLHQEMQYPVLDTLRNVFFPNVDYVLYFCPDVGKRLKEPFKGE